eukprot:gnl/MRDRNA2_/MRDRNA2_82380_c0_seq2.p1 gnl/MRDRNA2_/MRDRNA2_82380_c0~~gnl/MRDRNA2_/MRDRNA2_82380_c0_seq2.p1  ORF type:complete len:210 (-),score=35.50 gnl/MRDRNA2_/MRDRNA2_82380_c0_seq2:129-668(-)
MTATYVDPPSPSISITTTVTQAEELIRANQGDFSVVKRKQMKRNEQGKTLAIAAKKLADVIVGSAAMSLGIPGIDKIMNGFAEQLEADFSNTSETGTISDHIEDQKTMSLVVFSLKKESQEIQGKGCFCSGLSHRISVDGTVWYIQAKNQAGFNRLTKVLQTRALTVLEQLMVDAANLD